MEIREIKNKSDWENFLLTCTEKTFLQSWNWGEFNKLMGHKIWRLGAYSGDLPAQAGKIIGVSLVVKVSARRGTFLFVPHGPAVMEDFTVHERKEVLGLFLSQLKNIAKHEKADFIRISPLFIENQENKNIFESLGFKNSPMPASAYEATWKLDLSPAENDLVHKMRKTTRYLIRKAAENKDISIEIESDPKNVAIYQELNESVAKRQKFVPFSENSIKNEFDVFKKDNEVVFVFGKYKNQVAAGAMIIFWSGIAFYHQAASLGEFSKLNIPYLLQWEAIKEAEKRGCRIYDFWGFTDPEKFPKHPWAGPTLFKMGFGGYKKEYVKTQDFVISKKYWINYIIESIRKKKRGL